MSDDGMHPCVPGQAPLSTDAASKVEFGVMRGAGTAPVVAAVHETASPPLLSPSRPIGARFGSLRPLDEAGDPLTRAAAIAAARRCCSAGGSAARSTAGAGLRI